MKKIFIITAFLALSLSSTVVAEQQCKVVEIGTGNLMQEVTPIVNWWLGSFQGNETLFLKDELNMQPGDMITALSYHCVYNSAYGGNFNVRIINTTLNQLYEGDEDYMDPGVIKVPYESNIYGNVQLEPYSADCWITFELNTPFVYTGENIIIDIRNTEPSQYAGWCYFAASPCDYFKTLAWRNASDEAVTGFVEGYSPFGEYDSGLYLAETPVDQNFANIRITYLHDEHKPKITNLGDGNVPCETAPIVNWHLGSYQGSETIYLKEDLGLEKGDTISAISYHCISRSANGGNFNVRLMNTDEKMLYDGDNLDNELDLDLSLIRLNYTDTVYGNVQLGPYSAGNWITFKFTKPFIYEGENIIIDIRNTETGSTSFMCEFSSTRCDDVRAIWWRGANGEDVTEFNSPYDSGIAFANVTWTDYNNLCYPNIRIFANGMIGDVNDDGDININDVTALIDYLLSGDIDAINLRNADVNGDGKDNIADVTGLIDMLLSGSY